MFFCWLNIVQIWSEREREIVAFTYDKCYGFEQHYNRLFHIFATWHWQYIFFNSEMDSRQIFYLTFSQHDDNVFKFWNELEANEDMFKIGLKLKLQ
jgi:hypothetical protein